MRNSVLLVEDEPRSLKLITAIFDGEGFETFAAADGAIAIEILEQEKIDLVITDVLMPNVDGYYLCYKIRNHQSLKDIPIIIYSATLTSINEEEVAAQMGANLFLRKPTQAAELVAAARKLIHQSTQVPVNIAASSGAFEVMHQYNSELVHKLEQRNYELEEIKLKLEMKVQERTEELQTINEELSATNDQLHDRNEELQALNEQMSKAARIIQEQSEVILKQKDEQLNLVLDSSRDVIASFDLTGNGLNYLSRSAVNVYGGNYDQLVNEPFFWLRYVHPDDRSLKKESQQRLREFGETECTYRINGPNGVRWIRDRMKLIRDRHGKDLRLDAIFADVSDLKDAQVKMEEYKQNLDIIFQNSTDIFILLNPQGEMLMFNRAFENYVRDFAGALPKTGMDFLAVMAPNRKEEVEKTIQRNLQGEKVTDIVQAVWPNGYRHFMVIYTPVFTANKVSHITVTATDITDKKKQEDVLKEHRENLEIIFHNSTDLFILMNPNGQIILFNKQFETYFRQYLKGQAVKGMSFFDVLAPNRLAAAKQIIARVINGEQVQTLSESVYENVTRYYDVIYSPIISDGKVTHITVTSTDVTEKKKAEDIRQRIENELKRDQFFLEKASESAKLGYWTSELDLENGKLAWSKEVFKIFQLDEKDFDGRNQTFLNFVHPDDKESVVQAARLAIEQDQLYNVDHRIVLRNGKVRWVNERGNVISQEDGSRIMVGVVQDINDRKIIEQVLREYNDRFEILSKATNDAIWDWNIETSSMVWNHGIESIFGYTLKSVRPTLSWWKERIHPEDADRVRSEVLNVFENGQTNWTSEYRYRCEDGTFKHVLDRGYVLYHEGKPVRMIGAMQDISEIMEYRLNLESIIDERTGKLNQALLKEKELVDLKSKFISIASHEFRTPLTTIRLAAGFLKRYKSKLTPHQLEERASVIEKEVVHMTTLVDDVLFVGKMEEGKVKPVLKEYPLTLFEKLAGEAMLAVGGSHALEIKITKKERTFRSDEKLLRNVIFNLITNAVKFSPNAKKVKMQVQLSRGHLELTVEDEGIGIPQEELKNLFTSFSRATNAAAIEGTGLGLLIIKKAVELLNGTVNVWSEVGKGTKFKINIPLSRQE